MSAVGSPSVPAESSLTLDRGLSVLQLVADAGERALTVSELADLIGVSRAAVYRLLGPLQARDLVRRDGSQVRLGLGVLRLSARTLPRLRAAAAPALRILADRAGATAHLSIADGDDAHAIAVVEPANIDLFLGYRVGARLPLRRCAAGQAILLAADGPDWTHSAAGLPHGARGVAAPLRGVPALRASVGVVGLAPLDTETTATLVVEAARQVAAAVR